MNAKTSNPNVRLGIVGVGNMGTQHARMVARGDVPGMTLAAVCNLSPEPLEEFRDHALAFTDAQEMYESGAVDAVLIATPHFSHTSLGIAGLKAGLHVLVEKPISVHKADCEKLIAAHPRASDRVFAAMFNQRTDPRYRKLREMIRSGEVGDIQRVDWVITNWFRTDRYYASGGWRATWAGEGGGVLLNQCPHQLDLWQWLFGMPSKVTALCQMGRFHDIEVEDSVTAVLEYESGVQGVFVTTTGEAPGVNRLEVACDNGILTVDDATSEIVFLRNREPTSRFCRESPKAFGKPECEKRTIPIPGKGEQHLGILKNFTAAIRGREKLIAPAEEGIHSVELANAMLQSAFRGQTVSLPVDAAEYASELQKRIATSRHTGRTGPCKRVEDLSESF